jgi:enoyl-CoA hydratase
VAPALQALLAHDVPVVLNAQEMKARGFIQRVIEDAQLEQETLETAQRIAALAPQAARMNKQFLRQFSHRNTSANQVKPAKTAIHSVVDDDYAYAASTEHIEGISAFLTKRMPRF